MGIGNIICQKGITNKENEEIKYDKVLIFTSFGAIFTVIWRFFYFLFKKSNDFNNSRVHGFDIGGLLVEIF